MIFARACFAKSKFENSCAQDLFCVSALKLIFDDPPFTPPSHENGAKATVSSPV
jgi:hypothetical protein